LMPVVFLSMVLGLTKAIHSRAVRPPHHVSAQEMLDRQARASGKRLGKRRRDKGW
jgi:hypothetical protein